MDIISVPLQIIYFVRFLWDTFLQTSFVIGHSICQIFLYLWSCLSNIFIAIIIIIIELHQFLMNLFSTFDEVCYNVRNLSNCCSYSLINMVYSFGTAVQTFILDIVAFLKVIALGLVNIIYNFGLIVRGALHLMCDICIWTIMLLPRFICALNAFCLQMGSQIMEFIKQTFDDLSKNFFTEITRMLVGVIIVLYLRKNGIRIFVWCLARIIHCVRMVLRLLIKNETKVVVIESDGTLNGAQNCVICYDQPKRVLLLPCKHLCLCRECADSYTSICPLCRKDVYYQITVYT